MQSKRVWAVVFVTGLAALVTWFLTDRDERDGPTALEGAVSVPDVADRLAQAGLGCEAVIRNDPPDVPAEGGVSESALCTLGDAPNLDTNPVAALILVYESDDHERGGGHSPEGHALVYGDRWEVWVPDRSAARAAHDALGGRLEMPDRFATPSG